MRGLPAWALGLALLLLTANSGLRYRGSAMKKIAYGSALVAAIAATLGAIMFAHAPKNLHVATTLSSTDVMQMMKDAKSLPEESFPAH